MVVRDYSANLISCVGNVLEEYDAGTFHDYWKLSRDVIDELRIKKFYVHLGQSNPGYSGRPNYLNVAIVADNVVVDVEGSIRKSSEWAGLSRNEKGSFIITPLKSIEAIEFHKGSITTIRESSNAKLILIASILGDSTMGKYWIANTDEVNGYLIQFCKALMEAAAIA